MNIWRAVHREAMAAWRSMRYDLRRPSEERQSTEVLPQVAVSADQEHPQYDAYARRTRRVRNALVVAALAVGGAAATYFGVVGGLTALLAHDAAPPSALPGVTAERTPTGPPSDVVGKATRPDGNAPSMLPSGPAASATSAEPRESSEPRPIRPGRTPSPTSTRNPPVPTPAPHPTPSCGCPKPTPTPTGSPAPSPSPNPTPTSDPTEPPEWAVARAS